MGAGIPKDRGDITLSPWSEPGGQSHLVTRDTNKSPFACLIASRIATTV